MSRLSLLLACACALLPAFALAEPIDTKAQYAYMVDYDTGQVLLSKQADVAMHPSSMSKMMTAYILFSRLKEGRVKLDSALPVSEKAWRTQGSKMFVPIGQTVTVEDLIHGILTDSGNDACVVVAEGLAGSEEAFAEEMNATAKKLGLTHSHFVNATGLPDPNHLMSAHDLAILASHLISDFPEYYHYFSEPSFTYNKITQANRNRLIGNDIGVDGLKTGHTDEVGYGITLSAKDPATKRRIVLVVNGLPSDNDRIEEGNRLLHWGMREFVDKTIAKAGAPVADAQVWFGTQTTVKLAAEKDVIITLPSANADQTKFTLKYDGPVAAPIAKGAPVATLIVQPPGMEALSIPLVAAEEVPKVSGLHKIWKTAEYYLLHHQ